jgi:hypothetical protein
VVVWVFLSSLSLRSTYRYNHAYFGGEG